MNIQTTYNNSALKLIITITLFFITLISTAQESFTAKTQGNFYANGTIGVISTNEKSKIGGTTNDVGSTFQVTGTPRLGYFITDKITAGLELEVRTSTSKIEGFDGETTSNALSAGPFARYYFDIGVFAEVTAAIGTSKTTSAFGDMQSSIFALRGTAGYSFFIGDHVAIEPAINYTSQSQKPKGSSGDNKIILNTIYFSVGFTAYF